MSKGWRKNVFLENVSPGAYRYRGRQICGSAL